MKTNSHSSSGYNTVSSFLTLVLAVVLASVWVVSGVSADKKKSKSKKKSNKRICITMDELPVAASFEEVDREAITATILNTFQKHKVKAAGFVVSANINESFDLLGAWLNDGHVLGNLTVSHLDLHDVGIETFIAEIRTADAAMEPMLAGFGQKKRYFRYPFLHYGNTVESKREVRRYLEHHDKAVAHATVIVDDHLYNLSLEKLGGAPDSVLIDEIGTDYVAHVLDQIAAAEEQSLTVLKRPCRQILLLRANRLNSIVLDELLVAIAEAGYQFIDIDTALKDELYEAPEAYFGAQGVGYIDMIRQSNPDLMPAR